MGRLSARRVSDSLGDRGGSGSSDRFSPEISGCLPGLINEEAFCLPSGFSVFSFPPSVKPQVSLTPRRAAEALGG